MPAPDYSSARYWQARLGQESVAGGFEWLAGGEGEFEQAILSAASSTSLSTSRSPPPPPPRILHIGPGSSRLSLWLRERLAAATPGCIVNVDFAAEAVAAGRRWEAERWPVADGAGVGTGMGWRQADLLDYADVQGLMSSVAAECSGADGFDLVVDKSTADAVSCGDDVAPHPGLLRRLAYGRPDVVKGWVWDGDGDGESETVEQQQQGERRMQPVALLALHLACVTPPGAAWVCLSYSSERFVDFEHGHRRWQGSGTVSPLERFVGELWAVEAKVAVGAVQVPPPAPGEDGARVEVQAQVHRPKVSHWLYTLRRTKVAV